MVVGKAEKKRVLARRILPKSPLNFVAKTIIFCFPYKNLRLPRHCLVVVLVQEYHVSFQPSLRSRPAWGCLVSTGIQAHPMVVLVGDGLARF